MATRELFIDAINRGLSILVDNQISSPKTANNFQKTPSNINQVFKYIGIWNDQIDDEIQSKGKDKISVSSKGQIVKCPCLFIEFLPNDGNQILGGVTQYMDACLYFHIFSDEFNTPNGQGLGGEQMTDNYSIYDLRDIITTTFLGYHPFHGSALMSRYDELDYKHGTITKYLRGFHFCWNDDKGSIFDSKSSRYLESGTMAGGSVNTVPIRDWVSGNSYIANSSVVFFSGVISGVLVGYYLCLTSNSSAVFTPSEWAYLALWQANTAYVIDDYIFINYYVYQCNTANSDAVFNPVNWTLITRM